MRAWALAALDLVFPAFCPLCEAPLAAGRRDPLCGACWEAMPRIRPPWCDRCGLPIRLLTPPPEPPGPCASCRADPPAWDWAWAGAEYEGPVRDAIHALKFEGKRALARPLAALVAERLAAALRVPVRPRWLARVRATGPQSDLGAAQRRANVRGAFVAAPAVAGRYVVVVDDVLTTGATAAECARALRVAGAARVGVLTVARVR